MKKFMITIIAMISALTLTVSANTSDYPLIENSQEREGEITHLVLHFTSNVIANRENPYIMEDIIDLFREGEVSIHYFIDRDGTVYAAVPEERTAWHAGRGSLEGEPNYTNRLNHHSIGIEILGIGSANDMEQYLSPEEYHVLNPDLIGFTEAQYISLNELVNDILKRNHAIKPNREHIIGHSEYSSNNKTDPGELFDWTKLDFINPVK